MVRFCKKVVVFLVLFVAACSGGSDSGGDVENTVAGDSIPANFVGLYKGTVTITANASGLSKTDSFAFTLNVTADGNIRFDGDDPEETFTTGLTNSGNFSGSVDIVEDECTGTIALVGSVDGTNATGSVSGSGVCDVKGLDVDVDLDGNFEAAK